MARDRAHLSVSVNGTSVANEFYTLVINASISLTGENEASDTATIDLDDEGGQIILPTTGDSITISLGWDDGSPTVLFEGKVDKVNSKGARGPGRVVTISANSADVVKGKLKHKRHRHKDDSNFGDVAKAWGQDAGVQVTVHDALASIKRAYWGMHGESFMAWGSRMAGFLAATFKIEGTRAVFAPRSQGQSNGGQALTGVVASAGDNLITWDIQPKVGRPEHKKFRTKFYDRHAADWKTGDTDPDYETDAEAEHTSRYAESDEDGAKSKSATNSKESERNRGTGTVLIDGEPMAQPEAALTLIGARPGVDGAYKISTVDHSYERNGGWTTSCGVKQPSGGAGKDSRKATAGASAPAASPSPATPSTPTGGGGIGHA